MLTSTERFSSRVENYVKYRPDYPEEVLSLLVTECGLGPSSVVADIGSGTGISSKLLLRSGALVYGVEPNEPMRNAAERFLAHEERFVSINGAAESTTLPDAAIDLITAGQAFHWFDVPRTRAEFARILIPDGWVALMWNERSTKSTPFLEGYEAALRSYSDEYLKVGHQQADPEARRNFFRDANMRTATFDNLQSFDLEGLIGRALSSSYAPEPGHPNHEPMLEALAELFEACQVEGKVDFPYETNVYYGQI